MSKCGVADKLTFINFAWLTILISISYDVSTKEIVEEWDYDALGEQDEKPHIVFSAVEIDEVLAHVY